MNQELVSIISPVYNGEKYIGNYLDSILEQTYSNVELILVDDGSTDNTKNVVETYKNRFNDKRYYLIYKRQCENKGQAAAINIGLKIFSGTYMMWMDSDDILYSNAIEKKVNFLKANSNIDFVLNKGEIVSCTDIQKRIGILERKYEEGNDNLFKDLLLEKNVVYGPGTIMVRRDSIIKAIPDLHIYESKEGQNWQLMLPLAYTCKYDYLDEVLFKYVVHDDSHSHSKRNYEQEINRRDNFYILQVETINKIVGMNKEEKKYWRKFAEIRKYYNQYLIANRFHKYKESKHYKKAMNNEVNIPFKNRFIIMDICNFLRKVRDIARRILKVIF